MSGDQLDDGAPHQIFKEPLLNSLKPTELAGGLVASLVGEQIAQEIDPKGEETSEETHPVTHGLLSGTAAGGTAGVAAAKLSGAESLSAETAAGRNGSYQRRCGHGGGRCEPEGVRRRQTRYSAKEQAKKRNKQ